VHLTYEIWILWTLDQNYLEVLKCVAGERWRSVSPYQVRNGVVLRGVKVERNILQILNRRKTTWIGHILRKNCLLKHVIEGNIEGRIQIIKSRGRRCSNYRMILRKLEESGT
jgi:hypothetical protein